LSELNHDQVKVLGFKAGQALRVRGECTNLEAFLPKGRGVYPKIPGIIANDEDLSSASRPNFLVGAVDRFSLFHVAPLGSSRFSSLQWGAKPAGHPFEELAAADKGPPGRRET
jgi:hypothetical protein